MEAGRRHNASNIEHGLTTSGRPPVRELSFAQALPSAPSAWTVWPFEVHN